LFEPIAKAVFQQIKACCIALDAEVAVTEPMRAPYKLNQAREKRGRPKLFDYNVVKLGSRTRSARFENEDPDREKIRKRLHFRRGHWRHYESHKTWIRWTLVGDPDLGFIDKHYTL
jgi:hypothetical protein